MNERLRWFRQNTALQAIRKDLQAYGTGFTWERTKAQWPHPARLLCTISGQLDTSSRPVKKPDGTVEGRPQHTGFQHASFAMTLLMPLFPYAVIEPGGGVNPDGSWKVHVWLDCPEEEALRRELQHQGAGEA